jgi:hypothetical protein
MVILSPCLVRLKKALAASFSPKLGYRGELIIYGRITSSVKFDHLVGKYASAVRRG